MGAERLFIAVKKHESYYLGAVYIRGFHVRRLFSCENSYYALLSAINFGLSFALLKDCSYIEVLVPNVAVHSWLVSSSSVNKKYIEAVESVLSCAQQFLDVCYTRISPDANEAVRFCDFDLYLADSKSSEGLMRATELSTWQ